jgi:hypothetical protein
LADVTQRAPTRFASLSDAIHATPKTASAADANHPTVALRLSNPWLSTLSVRTRSYKYAIQSGSTAVLSFLKERCLKRAAAAKTSATGCAFAVA